MSSGPSPMKTRPNCAIDFPHAESLTMPRKKPDWRTLPRKPSADKRSAALHVRCTAAEYEQIKAAAFAAGMSLRDFVFARLSREQP